MTKSEVISPGEVCRALGIDPSTLKRWAASGKIKSRKLPSGHRRYLRADLKKLIAKMEKG